MLRVTMSLESNPPTLHTYIFIHIGIDAIIKASKIGEASTKIKVEIVYSCDSCSAAMLQKTFVLKISCHPYPDAVMSKIKSLYRLIPQNLFSSTFY